MRRSKIVAAADSSSGLRADLGHVGRWSLRAKLLLVVFLGVVGGGTAAWWGFPPVAAATTCNVHFNTAAIRTNGDNYLDYGVRASTGNEVYNGSVTCVHVASLIVQSDDLYGDEAEIGWHIEATGYSTCHSTGNDHPHVMYTWVAYSYYACYEDDNFSVSAGTYYPMSVRADLGNNKPTFWIYDFNGNVITEHDNGFGSGAGATNGERHYQDPSHPQQESAAAHFKGMQYRTASNTWANWGGNKCWSLYSNDPQYNNQLLSNTEVQVSISAPQC